MTKMVPVEYPINQLILTAVSQPVVSAIDDQTLIFQMRSNFVLWLVIFDNIPINIRIFWWYNDWCSHLTPGLQLGRTGFALERLLNVIIFHKIPSKRQFLSFAVRWQSNIDHINTGIIVKFVISDGGFAIQPVQPLI